MFDPDYLYTITDEETEGVNEFDLFLLALIISQLRITLKANPIEYQKVREKSIKTIYNETSKQVNKFNKKNEATTKKVFEEAAQKSIGLENEVYKAADLKPIPLKQNKELKNIIQNGIGETNATIKNYTKTTAIKTQRTFIKTLDEAYLKMIPKGSDLNKVMFDSLIDLATKGIFQVEYEGIAGKKRIDHADVAIRRALVTGINQTYAKATEAYAIQMGQNLVQVSQHQGARTGEGTADHANWQGKKYSMQGGGDKYPNLRTKTGYGTGQGLCGWNCRHSFGVYIEGITETLPQLPERADITYKEKTFTFYEATQEQRRMERNIRKWKRQYYLAKETNQPSKKINDKINYWQNEVKTFSKLIGTERRISSERVVSKF